MRKDDQIIGSYQEEGTDKIPASGKEFYLKNGKLMERHWVYLGKKVYTADRPTIFDRTQISNAI